MERRKVLAAVAAAISTPEIAAWDFEKKEPAPDSPQAAAARKWALDTIVSRLYGIEKSGPATLIDAFLLAEALDRYNNQSLDEFGGLLNTFLEVVESDRRYVLVPTELHEHVRHFIEQRKAARS